jgi:hypothetical protein
MVPRRLSRLAGLDPWFGAASRPHLFYRGKRRVILACRALNNKPAPARFFPQAADRHRPVWIDKRCRHGQAQRRVGLDLIARQLASHT